MGALVFPTSSQLHGIEGLSKTIRGETQRRTAAVDEQQQQATYAAAQKTIPAGQMIFAIVDEPRRLDYGRNVIEQADKRVQFVSPPPGIPLTGSSAQLQAYLRARGVGYVMLSMDTISNVERALPETFAMELKGLAQEKPRTYASNSLIVVNIRD
jgi:hypothetical protein